MHSLTRKMNIAQHLGYPENTKLLIVHADDAGLSHSHNRATIKCLEAGLVNSYSIMVPCPWFYEMADFAKHNPGYDCGVHLTLTCEWKNYRFGPVLPISEVPSLVDAHGHFFKTRDALRANAKPEHVAKELEAQVQKALRFGLLPSHLDVHMYSVGAHEDFFQIYKALGDTYKLPLMINKELMTMTGLHAETLTKKTDLVTHKVLIGNFDLYSAGKLYDYYERAVEKLTEGLNVLLLHPAFDDDEMKGITVDHPNFGSEWRQIDLDFFSNPKNRALFEKQGVQMVTWKEVKALLPTSEQEK